MPIMEYELNGVTFKEEIGEAEIEKALELIIKYRLERMLIYDYEYKYFELQKHLYEVVFRALDLDYLLGTHQKVIGIYSKRLLSIRDGLGTVENVFVW